MTLPNQQTSDEIVPNEQPKIPDGVIMLAALCHIKGTTVDMREEIMQAIAKYTRHEGRTASDLAKLLAAAEAELKTARESLRLAEDFIDMVDVSSFHIDYNRKKLLFLESRQPSPTPTKKEDEE